MIHWNAPFFKRVKYTAGERHLSHDYSFRAAASRCGYFSNLIRIQTDCNLIACFFFKVCNIDAQTCTLETNYRINYLVERLKDHVNMRLTEKDKQTKKSHNMEWTLM